MPVELARDNVRKTYYDFFIFSIPGPDATVGVGRYMTDYVNLFVVLLGFEQRIVQPLKLLFQRFRFVQQPSGLRDRSPGRKQKKIG